MRFTTTAASSLALLSGVALAHPGHDLTEEIAERRAFLGNIKRASLAHCADKLKARGVTARNIARRSAEVQKARQKRSLIKRDADTVLAESHDRTELGYTVDTDPATLFSGNNSCVLTPEVTQGPYYVGGEYVRRNLIEEQEGVNIVLDYQVIDVETCEPVPNVYLEMWHCNATGVYSGVVASGNGDSSDETNIDNTWLRGIQETDSDGVAQFESIFPGHYTSRATHIHLMVHTNATLYDNSTLGNDVTASHVGQTFFDQDLISLVEATAPYSTNTQELTTNADDGILSEETATDGVDPLMEYTLLGDSVSDGLFAWMAFGINTTLTQSIKPAVFYYESGGVSNPDSGAPGGDGGPPDGATPGAPPSGSATPSTGSDDAATSETATSETAADSTSTAAAPDVAAPSGTGAPPNGAPSGTGAPPNGAAPTGAPGNGPVPSGSGAPPAPSAGSDAAPTGLPPSGTRPAGGPDGAPSGAPPSGAVPSGPPPSGSAPDGAPTGSPPDRAGSDSFPEAFTASGSLPDGAVPTGSPPDGFAPSGAPPSGTAGGPPDGAVPTGQPPSGTPPAGGPEGAAPSGSPPSGPPPEGAAPSDAPEDSSSGLRRFRGSSRIVRRQ